MTNQKRHKLPEKYQASNNSGDACLRSVPIRLSNPDNEILDYVKKIAETMGLLANVAGISGSNCLLVYLGANKKRNNPLRAEIQSLGLWGKLSHQKFIPEPYKLGSRRARSGVIAGLIDTDGTLSASNSVRYYTTSPMLARDVGFVSRSLCLGCSILEPIKRKES